MIYTEMVTAVKNMVLDYPIAETSPIPEVDLIDSDSVLVIDVSKWQAQDPAGYANPKKMNWQKALDAGISGAIFRCGGGITEDWTYEYNRAECERLKIPFGVYHAFHPWLDVDKQISFFIEHFCGQIYPAPDIEVAGNLTKATLAARVTDYVNNLTRVRKVMIYTRASWWNPNIGFVQWASECPLWVAHYGAIKPDIPVGWKTYKFWQFSADENRDGFKYGVPKDPSPIDKSWYNGTQEQFMDEFSVDDLEIDPEPPVIKPGLKFRVGVPVLNVRSGPGIHYEDIGDLHGNDVVEVLNVNGSDAWIEFEPGKWACVQRGMNQLMTKLPE